MEAGFSPPLLPNIGIALSYCGKQLRRALVVEAYLYMLLFSLGLLMFMFENAYPEEAAASMARVVAKMDADEAALKAKRLEAEGKAGLVGAQHANHAK